MAKRADAAYCPRPRSCRTLAWRHRAKAAREGTPTSADLEISAMVRESQRLRISATAGGASTAAGGPALVRGHRRRCAEQWTHDQSPDRD